ncbi:MAG: FecR domain-containing protein [Betaproteobacteria bacterium]|nr:FecR domain-containing protein [Betaproteobacteria bacterium]
MKKLIIPGAGWTTALQQGVGLKRGASWVPWLRWLLRWLLVLIGGFVTPIHAATIQAGIEAVQMPAWLVREGRAQPLAAGMDVRNGDHIRTGAAARVYLKLAEGSTVKLGEQADLVFYSRSLKPASSFKAAIDVRRGAFRFTTGAQQRMRGQREVKVTIRAGATTAAPVAGGGADLWGKTDAGRDLILLIEGKIEIRHDDKTLELTEPLTYFVASQPVMPADPQQFKSWMRETEILPGDGMTQRGGQWRVLLARVGSQQAALAIYDTARSAGYPAQIKVLPAGGGKPEKDGEWEYQVVLTQLASEQEASVVAQKIKQQLGFEAIPTKTD